MIKKISFFAMLMVIFIPSLALAQYRPKVDNLKPLLVEAIKKGKAYGILEGPQAEALKREVKSRDPVFIDVKARSDLPQKGCKELEITSRVGAEIPEDKKFFPKSEQQAKDNKEKLLQKMVFTMQYCAHGDFPEDVKEKLEKLDADEKDDNK